MTAAPAAAPSRRIAVLDPLVADQIAAGEVIERPASVVKELVENALDAGAHEVHVAVEDGGCRLIAVRDDGHGMAPDDAERACLRHATSKLRRIDDLGTLESLGFRGEALASVAAAGDVTIVTRERDAASGVRVAVSQGRVSAAEPVGTPVGTTIEVRELFASLPARRKFLRSAQTELGHVTDLLQRLALARPDVGFVFRTGNREVLRYPAVLRAEERVRQVLGAERARVLLPVDRSELGLHVHGFASRAGQSYPNARSALTYVAGRLVRDRVLLRAVLDAYRALLPSGRYPCVVLFLDLPAGAVDVNVHPAKVEVRFAHADAVYGTVLRALRETLAAGATAPAAHGAPGTSAGRSAQDAGAAAATGADRVRDALPRYAERRAGGDAPLFRERAPSPAGAGGASGSAPQPASPGARPAGRGGPVYGDGRDPAPPGRHDASGVGERPTFAALRVVGQALSGYVVCEAAAALILVDQHAAHERVRFERLRAAHAAAPVASQRLLVPRVVELDPVACGLLIAHGGELATAGFELEGFGDQAILLRALPAALDAATDAERLLADLASDLAEIGASERVAGARDALLARIACHGAVRAGDPLERAEMIQLLADLDTIPFAATCPHGRPLLVELSREEIARRVRRT